jgi:hypothetical protein
MLAAGDVWPREAFRDAGLSRVFEAARMRHEAELPAVVYETGDGLG